MKKNAGDLQRLAQNALEKAGANAAMAQATARHLLRAGGSEFAADLLAKFEKLAAA